MPRPYLPGHLEHVLYLEAVLRVGGGVRVLDVLLDDGELLGAPLQHLHLRLQLLVVGVDRVHGVVLLPAGEQAVGDLDLEQVVQHLDLGLDQVGRVQHRRLAHAEVVGDEGEEPGGGSGVHRWRDTDLLLASRNFPWLPVSVLNFRCVNNADVHFTLENNFAII